MSDSRPLGLFDSGVGGLSIWRAVTDCLPNEATIYFADSAHCPYGSRSVTEIKALSAAIVDFLRQHHCKLIVVACNTASAAALAWLRTEFDLPLVGMEPAIKPAAAQTKTGHVGVLATAGTLQGALFQNTTRHYANGVHVHQQVGEGLVEQVEAGQLATPETEKLLRQYLEPMLAAGVDQIALGCTHYPLLWPLIQRIVRGRANVIDPGQAVARQVQRVLARHDLLQPTIGHHPPHQFYTTGQIEPLQSLVKILGGELAEVRPVTLPLHNQLADHP
ncbi:MAG: glutamate racemase [Anaerolineae bacterium]|nr:glutamate racemase [Anaerolineae bacterium]